MLLRTTLLLLGLSGAHAFCNGAGIRPCVRQKLLQDMPRAKRMQMIEASCLKPGTDPMKRKAGDVDAKCLVEKLNKCDQDMADILFTTFDQHVCTIANGCSCKKNNFAIKKGGISCKVVGAVMTTITSTLVSTCQASESNRLGKYSVMKRVGGELFATIARPNAFYKVTQKYQIPESICLLNNLALTGQHPIFGKFCGDDIMERAAVSEGYEMKINPAGMINVSPYEVTDEIRGFFKGHMILPTIYKDLEITNLKTKKTMKYPIGFFAVTAAVGDKAQTTSSIIHYSPYAKSYCHLDECANPAYEAEYAKLPMNPKYQDGGFTCEMKCEEGYELEGGDCMSGKAHYPICGESAEVTQDIDMKAIIDAVDTNGEISAAEKEKIGNEKKDADQMAAGEVKADL